MRILPILGLLCLSLLGYTQTPQRIPASFTPIDITFTYEQSAYLHETAVRDTTREGYHPGMIGNHLSFTGLARKAMVAFEGDSPVMAMDTVRFTRFVDSFHAVAAVPTILGDAERHEVVIINEAHHEPRHRVFTRSLLQGLYDRGYRHFGLETLANYEGADSLIQAMPYPTLASGYYTHEPGFSAMVQAARDIGFKIFGYESNHILGNEPSHRETEQMMYIVAYRKKHPEGKLLLHVGYSHAYEGELGGSWGKAMAQRLADTTGLDPLTINQTHFRESVDTFRERYEYRAAASAGLSEPSLFVNDVGAHWNFDNDIRWFDRYVFHPRTAYRYGRADYVFTFGRKPVYLDVNVGTEGPYLLQAYRPEDDMSQAVPRDVVETSAADQRALALEPGDYRVLLIAPSRKMWVANIRVE
ncbi:hypothetical protein [Lewinella sp. IMCC34191]|uniref:hypothetical protein n=1 Tax=Lewinella sp. IMCC34191 TaxID=2259172 RepID=UPI000E24ECF5|nr:hypothetical protein [Lewinella sp. IMCC34191]